MKYYYLTSSLGFCILAGCLIFPLEHLSNNDVFLYPIISFGIHVITGYTCIECGHIASCSLYIITEHICGIMTIYLKDVISHPYFSMSVWIGYSITAILSTFIAVKSTKLQTPLCRTLIWPNVTSTTQRETAVQVHHALDVPQQATVRLPECTEDTRPPECTICLEFMHPETITTTICGHIFHTACIQQWLQAEATCPICFTTQA